MLHTLFVCISGVIGNTAVSKTASLWFKSILMCFFDVSEFWEKENEIMQFYVYRLLFIIRKEVRFNE